MEFHLNSKPTSGSWKLWEKWDEKEAMTDLNRRICVRVRLRTKRVDTEDNVQIDVFRQCVYKKGPKCPHCGFNGLAEDWCFKKPLNRDPHPKLKHEKS